MTSMTTDETNTTTPSRMGRPSSYSTELAYEICGRLAEGQSLRAVCRDPAMPDKATILRWVVANEEFRKLYMVSCEIGMDALCDDALYDATAPMRPEDVQVERLKLDARKWYASKVAPKRWGDRIATEVSGPEGGPVQIAPAMPLVPREIANGIKALLTKAEAAAGIPDGADKRDRERLRAIVEAGPMHPDLYQALHGGDKDG